MRELYLTWWWRRQLKKSGAWAEIVEVDRKRLRACHSCGWKFYGRGLFRSPLCPSCKNRGE